MPEQPEMTGALPTPSQEAPLRNIRESRPASHRMSRPSTQNDHLDPAASVAGPTIQVTPPSVPQRTSSADRNAPSTGRQDSRTTAARPTIYLVPPSQQHGGHNSGELTKPASNLQAREPIHTTNEDHREPARGSSSTKRSTREPSDAVPNSSLPNPVQQQNFAPNEPPMRITSVRPPDDVPTGRRMTDQEADALCKKICTRIWNENMGKLYDKVVVADRRGNVDDRLYYQLLDFFYCFLPMVTKAPQSDPIVVRSSDLENHRKILNTFGEGRRISGRPGKNDLHRWFSRPSDGSFKSRMEEGLRGLTAAIKGKKGRGDQVAMK